MTTSPSPGWKEPNPIWVREMRQAARLTRTPLVLAGVTAIAGLTVAAVGGMAAQNTSPAEVGAVLFHTFFSIAFAVVSWVGPGVAALTVASERAGRTWEAVVLTGLDARRVTQGKLLASLTYIGLYLVALAPVGALPFLFGGVTPGEVVLAFVVLAVFAVIAVGFGLAVSSGAPTPATALLVTLPVAGALSLFTYFALGVGGSFAAHETWPGVTGGAPVWLPTALLRADFSLRYALFLVAFPATLAVVFGWLFYEITVKNLSDENADGSTGVKRWFAGAMALVTAVGSLPLLLVSTDRWVVSIVSLSASSLLGLVGLFTLAVDPPGPSRRVLAEWEVRRAGPVTRFLGPGMVRTAFFVFVVFALSQIVLAGIGILAEKRGGAAVHAPAALSLYAGYGVAFFAFLCGLATVLRPRPPGRLKPRAALALGLFVAISAPLFAVAIAGLSGGRSGTLHWIAAPSPAYVIAVVAEKSLIGTETSLAAAATAIVGWGALGALLGVAGASRLRAARRAEEQARARLDEQLRIEDAASAGATSS